MATDPKRSPLRSLTGLRFLAAILVVAGHYVFYFAQLHKQWELPGLAALNILVHHAVGVDFFFILSGFILTYNYFDPFGGFRGTRYSFWIARIARIYPVYLLGLSIDIVRFLEQSHYSTTGLLVAGALHPLLLQAWMPSVLDWAASVHNTASWDPPSWSISNEALFYLLFPMLLVVMSRFSRRSLYAIAGSLYLISVAIPATLIKGRHVFGYIHAYPWWLGRVLYYNPLLRLPEFVAGMGLGLLFMNLHAGARPTPVSRLPILVSLVSIPALFFLLALNVLPGSIYPVDIIYAPVLAVVIFSLAYNRGPVAAVLSSPLLVLLGEASYAIYILHWPIWYWMARINESQLHLPASSPLLGVTYFFLVIALSIVSFLFIERPARAAIKNRFTQARGASLSTSLG